MTRHWIEAYVDQDTVSFRCICEDIATCSETAQQVRGESCAMSDWFDADGTHLLSFPLERKDVLGRVEVAAKWIGWDEDVELWLVPPSIEGGASA